MKRSTIVVVVFFLLTMAGASQRMIAQSPQLAIISIPDTASMVVNPDSIAVDTNSLSPTFGKQFAKVWYVIHFDSAVFDLPSSYLDTATYLTWQDIDTVYASLRTHLSALESKYGNFHMANITGSYDSTKSDDFKPGADYNVFYFCFDSGYVCVDSVVKDFCTDPSGLTTFWYQHRYQLVAYVPNDRALIPGTPYYDIVWVYNGNIEDNNVDGIEFWPTHFHRLGWHWNHWVQKTPMAWEVTKGSANIYIAIDDIFDGPESNHPDMGNVVVKDQTEPWTIPSEPMLGGGPPKKDHGISVASAAVASGDNDGTTLEGVGMVGACYECQGVIVDIAEVGLVDVDGVTNGSVKKVDVVTSSSTSGGGKFEWGEAIKQGIVATRAGGNHRDDYQQWFLWSTYRDYQNANNETVRVLYNSPYSWGMHTYPDPLDPSDPNKDVKLIAVGATIDGRMYECSTSYDHPAPMREIEPYMSGDPEFHPVYNFGPGKDKFAIDSDPEERIAKKEAAWMDIVVPTGFVTAHDAGVGNPVYNEKFHPYNEGTSQANPSLAGIIGLMLAVNPQMGKSGRDVQRAVYDVITFTADKIPDAINYPTDERKSRWADDNSQERFATYPDLSRYSDVNTSLPVGIEGTATDGTAIQFDYVEQVNDPLNRWWAQRMGFGQVNAFRAVAHAISLKAPRVWTTSQSVFAGISSPPQNENGHSLMHMGGYNESDDLVLEEGGEDFPGESYNNQGVTYVNGTGTTLTVPENSILAIDGLLKTNNSTGDNRIETEDNGKILVTGYLEDVELVGNLRVDDLRIKGTSSSATSCIAIGGSSNVMHVYGEVVLVDYGVVNANLGALEMMPGSAIRLNGSHDLVINDGASVTMHAESEVTSTNGNEIVIEDGSTLTLKSNSRMRIGVHVHVKAGGTLVVDEKAVAEIASFEVDRDGEILIKKGAQLSLTQAVENVVHGRFRSEGTSTERVRLMGEVEDCCTRICTKAVNYAEIRIEDDMSNPTNTTECYANIRYTDVSNVPIATFNAPLNWILSCNFSGDRSILNNAPQKTLLFLNLTDATSINTAYNTSQGFPKRDGAWVVDCSFFDEAGDFGQDRGTFEHAIDGLVIHRMNRAVVSNSDFSFVRVGVSTMACDSAAIQANTFQIADIGIKDELSILRVCSNDFEEVEFGLVMHNTAPSWIYSNDFLQGSAHMVGVNSRISHFVRGNNLTDYSNTGIDLTSTSGLLNEVAIGKKSPSYSKWGRNHFEVNGSAIFPASSSGKTYDVLLHDQNANVVIACGYNQFAENSTFHIGSDVPKNAYIVNTNEFLDPTGYAVRMQNIAWLGTPINVSATLNDCGSVTGSYCGSSAIWAQFDKLNHYFISDGGWVDLAPTEAYLDSAFTHSVFEFQQDTINDEPRILKMRNAVEAARLGNSVSSDFTTLENALKNVVLDTNESDVLRFAAHMTISEVYDLSGDYSRALFEHDSAMSAFPNIDSFATTWIGLRLGMENIDPDYGQEYDSLNSEYVDVVIQDLRSRYDYSSLPKPMVPGEEEGKGTIELDLSSVSTLERDAVFLAQISLGTERSNVESDFFLPNRRRVKVSVVGQADMEDLVLLDGIYAEGKHRVVADVSRLPAGLYTLNLFAGNASWSRPFVVR